MEYHNTLAIAVLIPLVSFTILALFGHRIGKPFAGYVATAAIGLSCVLATQVLVGWVSADDEVRRQLIDNAYESRVTWADFGVDAIQVHVKLDSLTVLMFFMVTFVSFWIHFFSLGYMEGHSDEVDGTSKYHRFFAYLSLFCFSMLGLVVSSSLLFLFIFWELVGLCSYLLIGFYFDKKFASNAAMKAFIVNRVGDVGFLLGVMLVFLHLGTFDLDQAAARFATQFHNGTGLFASDFTLFGYSLATLMGIGLFCGAMGKSAQFPLHVWLPDAMAGPTPVSALIHAATMVAAGVYLVARVFRLLTPEAQMFIAVIGCITLTITALIAIVQTDIKKVLAYSTLSQLGYMIFGMGVGAWVAALFHLMTHAFFKAMLFLGSGQVIEGCHHEQDIRKMGGLRRKMPVTCWTFFIGVLAIAGFGIPTLHFGLGGYFSKDEILAVAYERAFNWPPTIESESDAGHAASNAASPSTESADAPMAASQVRLISLPETPVARGAILADATGASTTEHEEHAGPTGTEQKLRIAAAMPVLPAWMYWLPIIIAYVTPFYMMRCWWLTFCGKPRDEHVYEHAHENWKMWLPLVVLAGGTIFCSFFVFRNLIHDAAGVLADATAVVAIDGEAASIAEAGDGAMMTLSHGPGRSPHDALTWQVGFAWVIGMFIAWLIYKDGLALAERIKRACGPVPRWLEQKLYFDHIYDNVFVVGTVSIVAPIANAIDKFIVDGAANATAYVTRVSAFFTGRQLDMPVRKGDIGLVDWIVNAIAKLTMLLGSWIRRPQSGRIRTYIALTAGTAAVALLCVLFSDVIVAVCEQIKAGFNQLLAGDSVVAAQSATRLGD